MHAVTQPVEALRNKAGKVAGSILDGVIGISHRINPAGRTMVLGLAQPLSTRNVSLGGKGGRCVGLTTLQFSCADCLEIWEPGPSGNLRACPGLYRDCFTFLYNNYTIIIIKHTELLNSALKSVKPQSRSGEPRYRLGNCIAGTRIQVLDRLFPLLGLEP